MPTQHRRIAVTEDPELAAALRAVAPLVDAGIRPARLVRDLALRGADALLEEKGRHDAAIERLVAWSTSGDDAEALARARDDAWR
jgi:hypothetical protein